MPLHLSPELLAIIISFLPRFCLPLLSTVSRTWQAAIERHTMRAIHLRSNDLPAFATVFSLGHRRLALAQLDYDAILPSYSDHQCARFETDRDKRLNNEALTAAIHDLFSLLHSWEQEAASSAVVGNKNPDEVRTTPTTIGGKRGATARPISLALDVYSLSDAPYRVGVDVEEQREDVFRGDREDLFECRYQHSFLRLLRADELPLISRISTFETFTDTCEERRIEGASMAGMGAKMPNLETVAWWVDDNEKKYPEVRRMHRFEFAQSLSTLPFHNLRSLNLFLYNDSPSNQNFPLPSALLPSSPSTDHLSLALHHLSRSPNLAHLILSGDVVLSPSIFWPSSEQEDEWVSMNKNDNNGSSSNNHLASSPNTSSARPSPTPFWPHLQKLHITLSINTPTGDWLYIRDPFSSSPSPPSPQHPLLNPLPIITSSSDSDNSSIPDEYDHELEAYLNGTAPRCIFRKIAHSNKIDEWILAIGKAVGHMPAIKDLGWEVHNQRLGGIRVNFSAGEKWMVVIGEEARWEVSGKIRRVLEDAGVEVRVEIMQFPL